MSVPVSVMTEDAGGTNTQWCRKMLSQSNTWVKQQDGLLQLREDELLLAGQMYSSDKTWYLSFATAKHMDDGITRIQKIVKNAKSLVKFEFHMSEPVSVCPCHSDPHNLLAFWLSQTKSY